MRILIDLQGAQSESRFRGIGRYSLALALGVARNAGEHEIWLLMNGALGDAIADLRTAFRDLVPAERIRVFNIPSPTAEINSANSVRLGAAEMLREHFIAQLAPDMVLVTSLFEGYIDDAVISVGRWGRAVPTAVVLYDLIPFLNPDAYLGTQQQRQHYAAKIASLRKADLLLAISDYSRQEAIEALQLPADSVQAISTAVDDSFQPAPVTAAQAAALNARFGLERPFLMYAPGGFDSRKNIDGLIAAFGLLPAALRDRYQLVIASKLGEHERRVMGEHAAACGLAPTQLVLTGYVSDAELIALYRSTTMFVFPSKHEGFGLPALEAMACGALVIGANTTSVPEVIGCAEALFDPMSPQAIAAKMAEVLGDSAMQARLREHGRSQAQRFSWDRSALLALRAIEAHVANRPAPAAQAPRRLRLGFVSPLPPQRSGIADYAVQLLPALLAHADIELIVQQDSVALPPALAHLPQRRPEWLTRHAAQYDLLVYQFGNSPAHGFMFPLLQAYPGVVVLHDFFLSDVLAAEQASGAQPGAWTDALYYSHGYTGLASLARDGVDAARQAYPCNLAVLDSASAVVVHSDHAAALARQWYGEEATANWSVVPLPRALPGPTDRRSARAALGLREDAFVVCSFGFIAPTKLISELVESWSLSSLGDDPACELILVGAQHSGDYGLRLREQIGRLGANAKVRVTGYVSEASYRHYLESADIAVQLRGAPRGETSAAVLDCMNHGIATIVNASGALADLSGHAVWQLPAAFSTAELASALDTLRRDGQRRMALGQRAAVEIHTRHDVQVCAHHYMKAFTAAAERSQSDRHALVHALAANDALAQDERTLEQLAFCLAGMPSPLMTRQLLFDVSTIARHDLQTGIERVVRNQLLELLRQSGPALRIEPVYFSNEGGRPHYRYAYAYMRRLLGIDAPAGDDAVVDIGPRDLFYSADYAPAAVADAARSGLYAQWRAHGVTVVFLVYDLLPVLRPEFFPPNADLRHQSWLEAVAANADRLLCISMAVQGDLQAWLAQHHGVSAAPPTAVLQLGADLPVPVPAKTPEPGPPAQALSFLMVGTLEPRKGHLQALAAFERLWAQGSPSRLLIVGNEGWLPLSKGERRTIPQLVAAIEQHPELGKRLLWIKGADDETLQQLYRDSTCLLAASEAEGLGLPLIEAARYGLPILARDLPVFHEVAGENASYFAGTSAEVLAEAIMQWSAAHALDTHPRSKAIAWASWQDSTAALLMQLLGERSGLPRSPLAALSSLSEAPAGAP